MTDFAYHGPIGTTVQLLTEQDSPPVYHYLFKYSATHSFGDLSILPKWKITVKTWLHSFGLGKIAIQSPFDNQAFDSRAYVCPKIRAIRSNFKDTKACFQLESLHLFLLNQIVIFFIWFRIIGTMLSKEHHQRRASTSGNLVMQETRFWVKQFIKVYSYNAGSGKVLWQ